MKKFLDKIPTIFNVSLVWWGWLLYGLGVAKISTAIGCTFLGMIWLMFDLLDEKD